MRLPHRLLLLLLATLGLCLLFTLHANMEYNTRQVRPNVGSGRTARPPPLVSLRRMQSTRWFKGVVSADGSHVHYPHLFPPPSPLEEELTVCLATFASVNRLYWLPWLLKTWSGPTSIAVYVRSEEEMDVLVLAIAFLRGCFPALLEKVDFHVLHPFDKLKFHTKVNNETILNLNVFEHLQRSNDGSAGDNIKKYLPEFYSSELNCFDPEWSIEKIIELFVSKKHSKFIHKLPQNQMRNLARRSCYSNYSLIIDIDMIPAPGMYERLSSLLTDQSSSCPKCAFIVPVYEIEGGESHLPGDKTTLLKYLDEGRAQRYHLKVYEKNQGNSRLHFWEASGTKNSIVDSAVWSLWNDLGANPIQWNVTSPYQQMLQIRSFEEFWEPILVVGRDAPGFDERFVGFGFCRSSWTYELQRRRWNFWLLDEAFLSHWGFQTSGSQPRHRMLENQANELRYQAFKREVEARIPQAHRARFIGHNTKFSVQGPRVRGHGVRIRGQGKRKRGQGRRSLQ